MEPILILAGALIGTALGGVIGWLAAARRTGAAEATAAALRQQVTETHARADQLERSLRDADARRVEHETAARDLERHLTEQRRLLDDAEGKLGDTFQALAAQALQQSHHGFLALAAEKLGSLRAEAAGDLEARQKAHQVAIEGIVKPVRESIDKVDQQIRAIELERGHAYGTLTEQVRGLARTQERLEVETGNLVNALRAPAVRGRWGEIQLKRVVELAGMVEHCDFVQQETLDSQDGRLRPDLIVNLPNGHQVVVDAKVPLEAYLAAVDATADEPRRREQLRRHADQVRAHVLKLAAKSYWNELSSAPEFVVMFLPSEGIYHAALQESPDLIEHGVGSKVLIATPTTLIALLQAVHYGCRQEKLAENAQRISDQGRVLHERLATLFDHFGKLGTALGRATDSYNAAVGSFERMVKPAVRKLEELGAAGKKTIEEIDPVPVRPRELTTADADDEVTKANLT